MAAPKFNVLAATAADLQSLLLNGTLSSVEIVETYFEHIERHNKKGAELNVVISLAPLDDLREQATALDAERAVFLDKQQHNGNANIRSPGPVHGIPILVKDNIMTKDFDTTCGSFALKDVKVISNADVVDSVLQASMILLGKTNLSVTRYIHPHRHTYMLTNYYLEPMWLIIRFCRRCRRRLCTAQPGNRDGRLHHPARRAQLSLRPQGHPRPDQHQRHLAI